jgi:hypothetical protein
MRLIRQVLLCSMLMNGVCEAMIAAAEPVSLNRRELFVDRVLTDRMNGAELSLHAPQPAGTALEFNRPWEGAFCGYVTVLLDGDTYRMYYRGLPEAGRDGSVIECTCYAESRDGITWNKPDLGLYEIDGTRANNVLLKDEAPASHNFSPFVDTRPGVPAEERYKALGGTSKTGLIAFISADGLHWRRLQPGAVFNDEGWVFDSQNVAFWSNAENKYVLYYRRSPEGVRSVARTTSDDFRTWTAPEQMQFGGAPAEHLYTNQTHPYFRAPHIYLGVAARFMPGRRVLSDVQARAIHVNPGYFGDISDAVLLSTRGGNRYERTFLEAIVRPGPGWENWTSRTNYPALGIVPTGEREMSVYIQRNYGQPTARVDRYVWRLDGLASLHAAYRGGELLTREVTFQHPGTDAGPRLCVNYATSAAGGIRVEIQAADGTPAEGCALADCDELIGDEIERIVSWQGRSDLSRLAGQPLRLRIVLKDADLYSLVVQ